MKITAETTQYRVNITDPATNKVNKVNFPLVGTIKEKRQQIKDIKIFIANCRVEAKKLEVKALIYEAEACRQLKHTQDINLLSNVKKSRQKERKQSIEGLFERYKLTEGYNKITTTVQYQREKHFDKFVKFLENNNVVDIEQIDFDDAVKFMSSLKVKASTYNKYLVNLSGVFKGVGLNNPFYGIKRRNQEEDASVKIPFSDDELKLILSKFTGDWLDICKIAAYTGLRFIDVVHLKKENITLDFDKKDYVIKLQPAKTRHTGRFVYIQLIDELKFLLDAPVDARGYFFPDKVDKYKKGTRHAGSSLNHVFMKKLKAIDIKDKSFHCFRHRFVDKLRRAGFSDEQIGTVVGHSSIQQTKDYGDYHNVIDLKKTF